MPVPCRIVNARIYSNGHLEQRDLYFTDRVLAHAPAGVHTLDLRGYTVFPGLVNAHDHLELNHYPRTKFRDSYPNAHLWGEDVNTRLGQSPFAELRAFPLADQLFIGGLKNLLGGVTTVAHHNPPHRVLFRRGFPVRVLRRYGWSHSLHFSSEAELHASYRAIPPDTPWFIHLAEGTDDVAQAEYQRLDALGLVQPNTVLVHGVGLTPPDLVNAARRVRGLVACPTTNRFLLGETAHLAAWLKHGGTAALGSDSRLTGGDLLDELDAAVREDLAGGKGHNLRPRDAVEMVLSRSARLLGLPRAGTLAFGAWADCIVIREDDKPERALCHTRRADLALVVKGGVPQIGDPDLMNQFRHVPSVVANLDGKPKKIHRTLARRIQSCTLKEAGLELAEVTYLPPRRFGFLRGKRGD